MVSHLAPVCHNISHAHASRLERPQPSLAHFMRPLLHLPNQGLNRSIIANTELARGAYTKIEQARRAGAIASDELAMGAIPVAASIHISCLRGPVSSAAAKKGVHSCRHSCSEKLAGLCPTSFGLTDTGQPCYAIATATMIAMLQHCALWVIQGTCRSVIALVQEGPACQPGLVCDEQSSQ